MRRIFCVGKNYSDHVAEMGGDASNDLPVFFTKPADAIVQHGSRIPYAQATNNLHYEGELVVALQSGGNNISREQAHTHIYGFAAGCDLTRRDLQHAAKKAGNPWDIAKAFDHSAPVGSIRSGGLDILKDAKLSLHVNNSCKQEVNLSQMIWSIEDIIVTLSTFFALKAGDLIFTGTPKGVGPLQPGDQVNVTIDGLSSLEFGLLT